jgi:hypothetical protein
VAADGRLVRLRTVLRRPLALPLGLAAAAAAGAAYLYGTNPHQPGQLLPRCPFEWATGLLCPGCGGTRMTYDLMHGDVVAAFHDNAALLVLGLPAAGYLFVRMLREGLRGRHYRPQPTRLGTAAIVATAVVWAVGRNVVGA